MIAWTFRHKFLVLNLIVVACFVAIGIAHREYHLLSKDSTNGLLAIVVILRIAASAFLK